MITILYVLYSIVRQYKHLSPLTLWNIIPVNLDVQAIHIV